MTFYPRLAAFTRDQDPLAMILENTGKTADVFFHNIVDLIAHEEIRQERLTTKGSIKSSQRDVGR